MKTKPAYEFREQPPGELDEVVVRRPKNVHVEVMSDRHIWMGVMIGKRKMVAVNFFIKGRKLMMRADVD